MANEGFKVSNAGQPAIFTSLPEKIQRHNISDEELDMLCESRTDFVLEIMLIAAGTAIGTVPSALSSIYYYFSTGKSDKIAMGDFFSIVVFFCAVVLFFSVRLIYNRKSARSTSLRASIRDRSMQTPGAG